jgi:hypothetical protein
MLPDEVARLANDECLVEIRGAYPWKDKKYVLEKHPNYNRLYEKGNKKACYRKPFDIRVYRKSLEPIIPPESEKQELEFVADDAGLDDGPVTILDEHGNEVDVDVRNSGSTFGGREYDLLINNVESGLYVTPDIRQATADGPESFDE